jgi:anti-sigma regulatory factor (Ser/Thr protein kinase)
MTSNGKETAAERLTLASRLSELSRLPPWIEDLAARYAIPESTQFAMNLCLEEAISNVIRHGYSGRPDHSITVEFSHPREDYYVFHVQDEAPRFNPLVAPEPPAANSLEESPLGGQGIRLLRRFADLLEYETTQNGNRLSIGFFAVRPVPAKKVADAL